MKKDSRRDAKIVYWHNTLRKELIRMGERDFNEKIEAFLNDYLAEKMNDIRKQNKELVAQKAALAQKLESCEAFWAYEELEAEYIAVLAVGIYKQAMKDFHFFSKNYLE